MAKPLRRRSPRESDIDFRSLVTGLAAGISDAQAELDRSTAELVDVLANTDIAVVPSVTRHVDEDGDVSFESADPASRSMLELGFAPTRYQFSEATVDVEFDLKFHEDTDRDVTLEAGTYELREQRKLQQDVSATATLSATLVPVSTPPQVVPETVEGDGSGGENADSGVGNTDSDEN